MKIQQPSSEPLVSVVILNWNSLADTKQCLEGVRSIDYPNLEIVVVDNGSADGSKQWLRDYEGIVYVDNPVNRGFTGGHIDGLKAAKGEFILLLNNDAVVKPDIVKQCIRHFEDPEVFAVGGRAYHWNDDSPLFNESNPFYSFFDVNPVTAEALPHTSDLGMVQEVNTVSGSAVMVRKAMINKIGYLYEPFFAYYEETDLFARAKRACFKVLYDPAVMIWHKNGASTAGRRTFFFFQMSRNRWIFALRNFDQPFLRRFIKRQTITCVKAAVFGVLRRNPEDWAQFKGFMAGLAATPRILKTRRELFQAIDGGYNKKLILEAPEPISIAVDCTDGVEGLEATLASIQEQEFPGTEVLLYCPASKPHHTALPSGKKMLRKVINRYGDDVRFENFTLTVARYNWIVYLRPGDKLPANFLREAYYAAVRTAAAVVYAGGESPKEVTPSAIYDSNFIGRVYLAQKRMLAAAGYYNNEVKAADAHHLMLAKLVSNRCHFESIPLHLDIKIDENMPLSKMVRQELATDAAKARWNGSRLVVYWNKLGRLVMKSRKISWLVVVLSWLTEPAIKLRVKLGRLKLLLRAGLRGRRKEISLQLRHIRNELVFVQTRSNATTPFNDKTTPIFIISRDRLEPLRKLVDWLESAGYEKLYIVDNDSSYPPLVKYLSESYHQILYLDKNVGHTSPWDSGIVEVFSHKKYYVVTDPDVIPAEACPPDVIERLHALLLKYPLYIKAGLGLKIDDLPDHYALKNEVIAWESQFWQNEIGPDLFEAGVDTTFALYCPGSVYAIHPSLRTGGDLVAHHLPWYVDNQKLTAEDKYYREHASSSINSWDSDILRDRYSKEMTDESEFSPVVSS